MKWRYVRFGWWYACALLYFWFFATAALNAYRYPFRNWDMIAYMGVVESFPTSDPQAIYDATMADIRPAYDPHTYDDLSKRHPLSNHAGGFYQQLPFYSIKPLYTGGIWLLHGLGLGMAEATYMLSIISFLALGTVCYFFVPSTIDAGAWWIILWLFCKYGPFPMSMVAHLSTPDALCITFSLLGYCLWVYRRSFYGFAACFLLAQLSRPDILLLSSALVLLFTFCAGPPARLSLWQGLGFLTVAAALYVTVNTVTGNYGWKALFYYNFINKSAYPADVMPRFGWRQYMEIVRYGIVRMIADGRLQLMLALSLGASACCLAAKERQWIYISILWLVWAAFAVRFAFFPAWGEERYYYPYYFIMLLRLWKPYRLLSCCSAARPLMPIHSSTARPVNTSRW